MFSCHKLSECRHSEMVVVPQSPRTFDAWSYSSTKAGHDYKGSVDSNDLPADLSHCINHLQTPSVQSQNTQRLWLSQKRPYSTIRQTPVIPYPPVAFGLIAPSYDPIIDMHRMPQETTHGEDGDSTSTSFSPNYAKDLSTATAGKCISSSSEPQSPFDGLGAGGLPGNVLYSLDFGDASHGAALPSLWTMEWTIQGMSVTTKMTFLNLRLFCDGAPLNRLLTLQMDLKDCRTSTGAHQWKGELSRQLQVTQKLVNANRPSHEHLKDADCRKFMQEIEADIKDLTAS